MIRRPPRSTQSRSSAASDVYKRQNKDCLNKFAKILLLKYASDPPLRITQFPDLKHNVETSAVTLGLLSYIIPIIPIGIVTFFILRPFGLIHSSSS